MSLGPLVLTKRSDSSNCDVNTIARFDKITWDNPTPVTVVGPKSYLTSVNNQYFSGQDISDFHARKKQGQLLPQTTFRMFKVYGSAVGSYRMRTYGGDPNSWSEWYSVGNMPWQSGWVVTEGDLLAYSSNRGRDFVQDAAAAIATSGFDALTFVAELTDVRRMFFDLGKRLMSLRLPSTWRKMRIPMSGKALSKAARQKSSDYLSYRYGWRTLVYDLLEIDKLIQNYNEQRRTRYSEHKGEEYSHVESYEIDYSPEPYYDFIANVTDTFTVGNRGSVIADITIPRIQANPFNTAWELIPFSFVIDWFVSVGKSIAAISFLALNTKYAASFGSKITCTRSFRAISSNYDYNKYISGERMTNADCTGELRFRNPCVVPFTPHLSLRLDTLKVFDLVALVVQRFRR